ncbi:MAG: DEAD/DEAH box helicase, partial [Caldilineaceae bacterium]|nr:DEAD/DEAH box helicase [Caldilineaceae bacterium]
ILYVSIHSLHKISKYIGQDGAAPQLSKIGSDAWKQLKARTKRKIKDIAAELIKLYAARRAARGHAFPPDGYLQNELEASFIYEDTPDQFKATNDIKGDMEKSYPMDRLICGDVGFGKTEVAIRAAFKAVCDGKQVAVLVPTTILALQHGKTFAERLSEFPVTVEYLNRFRTAKQRKEILEKLKAGTIDIIIGTHALLSKDVAFKDLGLLIVDEEQKFGVASKEKLRTLKVNVDTLTLTATPIPRTLHMSLSGVRDLSTIDTPPEERLPIQTTIAEYDEPLIRQAILREMDRGGQIFYVYNRVMGIEQKANRIRNLLPEVRVTVGHGQMSTRQLEKVMVDFLDGQYDVLVSTTIVESGLDMPNVNTIIIDRADRMGLAQLYQLRGRVGRGAVQAYAYLLTPKHTELSPDARKRLEAIAEASELGAGFRIAMRDLEIRGAGDLLGAKQHGNIDSVGFDLYTRLLAQAVNEAKRKKTRFEQAVTETVDGETEDSRLWDSGTVDSETAVQSGNAVDASMQSPLTDYLADLETPFDMEDPLAPPVQLDLPIDAQIPEWYIEEEGLRLQIYRRIAGITHVESIDEMRKELLDRFGKVETTDSIPEEVENLLFQIRVKILALKAGVERIGRELDQLVLRSEALENMNRPAMQRRIRIGLGMVDDEGIDPEQSARVARRAIYLPIDEEGAWKVALVRTLEIMAYS